MSANIDENGWAFSLDESESPHDMYGEIVVPSHLVDDAADLSQYYRANSLFSFEKVFSQESSLTQCNSGHAELKDVLNHPNGDSMTSSNMAPSPPIFS